MKTSSYTTRDRFLWMEIWRQKKAKELDMYAPLRLKPKKHFPE